MWVTDFLQNSKFTPKIVWELVKERIDDSEEAFLLVDDSVQNKQYSHSIETMKIQIVATNTASERAPTIPAL